MKNRGLLDFFFVGNRRQFVQKKSGLVFSKNKFLKLVPNKNHGKTTTQGKGAGPFSFEEKKLTEIQKKTMLPSFVRVKSYHHFGCSLEPPRSKKKNGPGDAAGLMRIWDAEHCSLLREVSTGMTCCAAITALGMRRRRWETLGEGVVVLPTI